MKAKILVYALLVLILNTIHLAQAQLTKVTVGYSAIAAGHLPAWVAKEAGIFAKNGLDVQLVYLRAGTTATMALAITADPNKSAGWPSYRECQSEGR
jgi:ABC-type nitrate/sulfonate/bicarbonate transport system substrate-binding protein